MKAPWLSVVMPVHHGARDLPATLESLTRNDVRGIEFLLYDSSTDDSCEQIVANYSSRVPLVYNRLHDSSSWPAKTNIGVCQARAPHVAMLHHDDLWLEGHADMLRESLGRYPEAVMHAGPSRLIDQAGRGLAFGRFPCGPGFTQAWILAGCYWCKISLRRLRRSSAASHGWQWVVWMRACGTRRTGIFILNSVCRGLSL